ncbi:hypothetical protein HPP92_022350 [Vanilla planifolia]|uniref:Ribosomal protein L19 n=1 Tax=Vanilla planifolia TaxID=51239 RepID=A0A835Q0E4_VANPL|nr:hypothetical protein HPP92_022350 [Vanilla planifolia]
MAEFKGVASATLLECSCGSATSSEGALVWNSRWDGWKSTEHSLHLRELMVFNNAIFSHDIFGKTPLSRCMTTLDRPDPPSEADQPHVKFKRLDKTAKHIMNILDKEAVDKVKSEREIPDIRPGYIIQLKVEVPENKRRISTLKGIVIARRNAGLNSTFRLRRLVAGVGV